MVSLNQVILGINAAALNNRQNISLYTLAADIGTGFAFASYDFVNLIDKNYA